MMLFFPNAKIRTRDQRPFAWAILCLHWARVLRDGEHSDNAFGLVFFHQHTHIIRIGELDLILLVVEIDEPELLGQSLESVPDILYKYVIVRSVYFCDVGLFPICHFEQHLICIIYSNIQVLLVFNSSLIIRCTFLNNDCSHYLHCKGLLGQMGIKRKYINQAGGESGR